MIEIYNKDCMDLLRGESIQKNKKICIVTDPPFNIGYKYKTYKDRMKEDEYYDFLKSVFTLNGFPFVVIHYPEQLYKLSFKVEMFPSKVVSWVYNANTKKQHRDIAFFGIVPNFAQVKQPYKNLSDKRIQERIKNGSRGTDLYDWWFINQVKNVSKEKTEHPCQMPLEVMKNIIGIIPEEYDIFDPFMGSGTTGVACKELGRNFIGCEIDETYFEIAKNRIEQTVVERGDCNEPGINFNAPDNGCIIRKRVLRSPY